MPTDIILYALIAAGLVFWLRSILGTRHGEERDRPNPFAAPLPDKKKALASPQNDNVDSNVVAMNDRVAAPVSLPKHFVITGGADDALGDVMAIDPTFDLLHFANGVADAYAYVVEAFADGDRESLKELLAPEVYRAFDAALNDRASRGETVATEIHAVRRVELMAAHVKDKMVFLTLRFTADETCVIRDREGGILSGHPDHVTEMIDMWTFGRPVKSKDPRWLVYETSDGDVVEDHKTPVPDSHA